MRVNSGTAYRKGEYFRKELPVNNSSSPLWTNIIVAATGQTSVTGNVFLAKAPEAFTYDADGNLTSDGRWTNRWDAENRLIGMETLSAVPTGAKKALGFSYDARGRRISLVVSNWSGSAWTNVAAQTRRFVYDDWNLLAALDGSNARIQSFVWGPDLSGSLQGAGGVGGLLAVNDVANGVHFAAYDGNGNVMALVKGSDGTVSANYEYGPFGETVRATGPMAKANVMRFSTKYQDADTDFLYYGYRSYNPSLGRWLSRDPCEESDEINLYCFVSNDGIDSYDILGLAARTFPLYRLPFLKKPVLAYADVYVWRSSHRSILIKLRVWRQSDEQSRRRWNDSTAWPSMPQVWDDPLSDPKRRKWLWPNMASLLNARPPARYGQPDPHRGGIDSAFFGAVAKPEGSTGPPLVSADWDNDNGAFGLHAISHSAHHRTGFVIRDSSGCANPPPIGLWLVFPDGNRGGKPGGGWPVEWDGTVYLYTRITWSGDVPEFEIPDGPPPASPMANEWETWKNSGAVPRFIY